MKALLPTYLLLILFSFSSCEKEPTPEADEQEYFIENNGVFEKVLLDEEPVYLDGGVKGFLRNCFEVIKYPAEARENGVEGTVGLMYIITDIGTVEDIIITQDLGASTGEEAKTALEAITQGVCFEPAMLNGSPVTVMTHLPVRFKLE